VSKVTISKRQEYAPMQGESAESQVANLIWQRCFVPMRLERVVKAFMGPNTSWQGGREEGILG
jgi:hypothetical protein